jgi:hypothetical protein
MRRRVAVLQGPAGQAAQRRAPDKSTLTKDEPPEWSDADVDGFPQPRHRRDTNREI